MAKQTERRNSRATFVETKKDQRVIFRVVNKESRRRCVVFCTYFAVFVVGILIGLIPFILQYVKDSEADRDTLRQFVLHQEKLYNLTAQGPSFMAISSHAKKVLIKKSGSAPGNEVVKLSCGGKMNISSVTWNDIATTRRTIKQFDTYCVNNMKTIDNINICDVSMQLVYKWNFNNTASVVKVDYNCEVYL